MKRDISRKREREKMNLENGFSVIQQNRDVWIPATPVHTPNQALQVEMQKGGENWDELLGIYSGVLQDQNCSELPPEYSFNSLVDPTQIELVTRDFPQYDGAPQIGQNVAFAEMYNTMLPWDNNSTHLVGLDYNPIDKWRSFNQNATSYVSYLQNKGNVVPHQRVDSMAELLGMKSTLIAPIMTGGRITCAEPAPIGPYLQLERHWNACRTDDMMQLQKQIFNGNQDVGGYNLQQIPTSKHTNYVMI